MKIEKWIKENAESLKGKTIAISGSTGGLGRQICKYVASLGGNLLLLDRNEKRSKSHKEELCFNFPGISIKTIKVDMDDVSNI